MDVGRGFSWPRSLDWMFWAATELLWMHPVTKSKMESWNIWGLQREADVHNCAHFESTWKVGRIMRRWFQHISCSLKTDAHDVIHNTDVTLFNCEIKSFEQFSPRVCLCSLEEEQKMESVQYCTAVECSLHWIYLHWELTLHLSSAIQCDVKWHSDIFNVRAQWWTCVQWRWSRRWNQCNAVFIQYCIALSLQCTLCITFRIIQGRIMRCRSVCAALCAQRRRSRR